MRTTPPPADFGGTGRRFAPGTAGTDASIAARATGGGWWATLLRYASLTKPGVLAANVMTLVAGFLLASGDRIDGVLLAGAVTGTTLVIASACTINNVLDRDIDTRMLRTSERATVTGSVTVARAAVFGVVLGAAGLAVLVTMTNALVVIIGVAGFVTYVVFYGMLGKRRSVHGTLVGSLSGAAPILAGYAAVTGQIDGIAALAFLALFAWQMPEFYSIAIYRRDEYAAAGVPVISVVYGVRRTIAAIFAYTAIFVAATLGVGLLADLGIIYAVVMGITGAGWIGLGVRGFSAADSSAWARQMFRYSLIAVLVFCVMISIGAPLP
ncbi:heme o synthase [uncultured Microbacterium sp.]|uniref:heme o synthase n=1 Tax=uncultured Microbacterium sp. TaxID=191216 RepID=UPI0035CC7B22